MSKTCSGMSTTGRLGSSKACPRKEVVEVYALLLSWLVFFIGTPWPLGSHIFKRTTRRWGSLNFNQKRWGYRKPTIDLFNSRDKGATVFLAQGLTTLDALESIPPWWEVHIGLARGNFTTLHAVKAANWNLAYHLQPGGKYILAGHVGPYYLGCINKHTTLVRSTCWLGTWELPTLDAVKAYRPGGKYV